MTEREPLIPPFGVEAADTRTKNDHLQILYNKKTTEKG